MQKISAIPTICLILILLLASCSTSFSNQENLPLSTDTALHIGTEEPKHTPEESSGTATQDDIVNEMAEGSQVSTNYRDIPGVYLGTFHGTSSTSLILFEKIGKGIAISASYLNFPTGFNSGFLNANASVGRISLLTLEYRPGAGPNMQGYEDNILEAIPDGVFDDHLINWAEGMHEFGKPVFVRFGHEMNGDWYPWSGVKNGGGELDGYGSPVVPDGPERYVNAFRYLHDIFHEHDAGNVLWVWCPNAPFEVMEDALGPWNNAAAYYPGDDYVDWLCFDGYNWGASAFGQEFNAQWTSFEDIFGSSYAQLQAINPDKPILIGEFASTEDGGDKPAWIRDTFKSIRNDFPQIRGLVWFHIAKETDWRINSSDAALNAYSQSVADDSWLSEYPGMIP